MENKNLELSMQELEEMEAPGFWTGAVGGAGFVFTVISTATAIAAT